MIYVATMIESLWQVSLMFIYIHILSY